MLLLLEAMNFFIPV